MKKYTIPEGKREEKDSLFFKAGRGEALVPSLLLPGRRLFLPGAFLEAA